MAFVPPIAAPAPINHNPVQGLSQLVNMDARSGFSGLLSNNGTTVTGLGVTSYVGDPTPQNSIPMTYRTQEGVEVEWGGAIAQGIMKNVITDIIDSNHPMLRRVFTVKNAEHGTKCEIEELTFSPGVAQLNPDLGISSLLADSRSRIRFGMDRYSIGAFEGMWYAMTPESKETLKFRIAQLRDAFVRALLLRCYRELMRVRNDNDIWSINGIETPREETLEAALIQLNVNVARMFGIFGKDPDRAFAQVRVAAERALATRGETFTALLAPTSIKEFGRGTPASMEAAVIGEQRAAMGYKGVGPINDITQGIEFIPFDRIRVGPDVSNVVLQGQNIRTFGSHVFLGNLEQIRYIRRANFTRGVQDERAYDMDRGVYQVVSYFQALERSNLFEAASVAAGGGAGGAAGLLAAQLLALPPANAGLALGGVPKNAPFGSLGVWGVNFFGGLIGSNDALHPQTRGRCPQAVALAAAPSVVTIGEYLNAIGYTDVIAAYFVGANIGGGPVDRAVADFRGALPGEAGRRINAVAAGPGAAATWGEVLALPIYLCGLDFWRVWANFDIPLPFAFALARFSIRATMSTPIALNLTTPVGLALASGLTTTQTIEYRAATSTQIVGSLGVAVTRPNAIQPIYNAVPVQYHGGGSLRMYTNNDRVSEDQFAARASTNEIVPGTPDAVVIPVVPGEVEDISQTRVMSLSWPTMTHAMGPRNNARTHSQSVPFMANFVHVKYAPTQHVFGVNVMIRGVNSTVNSLPFNVVTWQGVQNHASPTASGAITFHGPDSLVRCLWLGEPQQDEIANIFNGAGGSSSRVVSTTNYANA